MNSNRRAPRPATVIACIALFFAVAGGSAIALQGRNSVDSGDIKKGAVKTSDIANNAVTTKKIRNNHVRAADIQNNAVGTGEIGNGQVQTADFAPAEAVRLVGAAGQPTLGNGGEGDCIWSATPSGPPLPYRFSPPGFYKDVLGYVHLTGVIFQQDGPGGDAMCGGGGPGETSEDAVAFVLPEGYRPTNDGLYIAGGAGTLVIGSTPLVVPPSDSFPAGAVATFTGGSGMLLDGVIIEPAGTGGGLPRRGTESSTSGAESLGNLADLFG